MKYIKMMGLLAVAAAALMAFVGTASATVLESSGGNLPSGTKVESTGTNAVLEAGFATIECAHSEVDGKTSNAGGASETVEGSITTLSFKECNATVKVLKNGKLIVHHSSGSNGTVTSEGAEVTVAIGSTSCVYGTTAGATSIGTLSGGSPAKLNASASLTRISGGFLCANPAKWTATYTVTTPNPLYVTAS
ncbi:MAG: hypothetical protein M3335_02340 [Actinomycetota bacterium]|nr:hypothetical protein [Actinomycetota bacterium]